MSIYEDAKAAISDRETYGRVLSCDVRDARLAAMAREVVRLTEVLQHVVDISDERDLPRNGWRVVERMRKVAIGTIDNEGMDV